MRRITGKLAKGMTALLLSAVLFAGTACGSAAAAGTLDTTAARRDKTQQTQTTIIDDEAVALAGQADQTTDAAKQAKASLDLVNQQREAAGLSDLTWNNGLVQAAQVRASECATSFSHTRPNGSDWWTVNSDLMYGENLAQNYSSAKEVVAAWMNSPSHKANILSADYHTIGVAVYQDANGVWYWAEEFGL